MDPAHFQLESQIVLYRGIHPAYVLALGEYVCIYYQDNIVVYE
jgi:hypothetical protein